MKILIFFIPTNYCFLEIKIISRTEREAAKEKIRKEEEIKSNSLTFSKAAKYFFGSSSSSAENTNSTNSAENNDFLSIINVEKERKKEEKTRRKMRESVENAPSDEENDDVSTHSTCLESINIFYFT